MKKTSVYFLTMVVLVITVLSGCQKATEKKPVPKSTNDTTTKYSTLMNEAGADTYTNGCVSCHKKTAEIDRSLPAYVKRIEGHPDVKEGTVNACYFCHEAQKNYELYKRFYRAIHKSHWKSNTFYAKSKGKCYSCHTVESNGVAGIKEYPLAGYRTGVGVKKTVSNPAETQSETKTETKQGSSSSATKGQEKSQKSQSGQSSQSSQSNQSSQSESGQGKIPESSLPGFTDIPTPTP